MNQPPVLGENLTHFHALANMLADTSLSQEHRVSLTGALAALAVATQQQRPVPGYGSAASSFVIKAPTMVTSKTQTAADQFPVWKAEFFAYARSYRRYDLDALARGTLTLTPDQDAELYDLILQAMKPVDLWFVVNGNGNSSVRSGISAWTNILNHFEPKTQAHVLTLVRSLVKKMECHSRAKLSSMAKYLGDFQTLFHRLLMTDPTVEEIMVAVLLQSLPRDPTWSTFVSNLLQYSKDERLTVQHVMDRVLSFDSAESVRQGPTATALTADATKVSKDVKDMKSLIEAFAQPGADGMDQIEFDEEKFSVHLDEAASDAVDAQLKQRGLSRLSRAEN